MIRSRRAGATILAADSRASKVANRGISGDTSRGLLARLDDDVLALNPRGIVLLIGTNDIEVKVPPEGIAANVKLLLEKIARPQSRHAGHPLPGVAHVRQEEAADGQDPQAQPAACRSGARKRTGDGARHVHAIRQRRGRSEARGIPRSVAPERRRLRQVASGDVAAAWRRLGSSRPSRIPSRRRRASSCCSTAAILTGWGFRPTSEEDLASIKSWRRAIRTCRPGRSSKRRSTSTARPRPPDGRFRALNGRLVVTTPTEGRRIQQLYTTRDFPEDFTLKLEFRATPNADSGVFLRGRQLQCRDYPLAGPYKNLKNYKPQDWNELVVTVKGNTAHCTCNGEVLEEAYELPDTGPIGLEGDRGQMEYRRIRIRRD